MDFRGPPPVKSITRVTCWKEPIMEVIKLNKIVGEIKGSVIEKKLPTLPAPSKAAAS